MFSIGFAELLVIAVIMLLVVGPERLPDTIRTISVNLAKFRRYWSRTKRELEQELGLDDIRREIHNAEVLEHLRETQKMLNEPVEKELERRVPGSTADATLDPAKTDEAQPAASGDKPASEVDESEKRPS